MGTWSPTVSPNLYVNTSALRWKGHGPLRGDDGRCGAASEEEPASDGENKGRGKLFVSELFISEIQTKRIIHLDCFCLSDRSDAPFSESAKRGGSIDQSGISYWAVHKFIAIHEHRSIRKEYDSWTTCGKSASVCFQLFFG